MIRLAAVVLALSLAAPCPPAWAAAPAAKGLSAPADAKSAEDHSNDAFDLFDTGDYDAAIAEYDRALAIDPDYLLALTGRALVRAVQGRDLDLAMADCDHAMRLNPKHPTVYFSRALIHYRRSDFAAVIADVNRGLEVYPDMYSGIFLRGMAEDQLGRKAEAQRDFATARGMSPDVADQFMRWHFLGYRPDGSGPGT